MAIGTMGALLIGGGLLGSAALSSSASRSAGNTVSSATDRAADLQNQQFQQLLALQMPGYQRGQQAADIYGAALGIPGMIRGGQSFGGPSMTGSPMMQGSNPGFGGGYSSPSMGGFDRMMTAPGMYDGMNADMGYSDFAQGLRPEGSFETASTGQFGQAQAVPAPGQPLVNTQQSIADQVMQTPGYQAQLDQGIRSIDRAAPLVGGMYSGRRMKALNDYGQQTFGGYYQNWLDRVGGLAGQAQTSANAIGQAGMQNASNVGGLMVQGANARAQGSMNSANAWSGAIGTGIGAFGGAKGWF